MSRRSPFVIELSEEDRSRLESLARMQLVDCLGILVPELAGEGVDPGFSVRAGFRLIDLMQR